jgi:hypothetical protein
VFLRKNLEICSRYLQLTQICQDALNLVNLLVLSFNHAINFSSPATWTIQENFTIIDVREKWEWDIGHIAKACHIP